ncbi:NAD(P)H-hydrate dehydratase [Pseudoflavitalea sp. G-6-1-2]|uniref:NAD(P)H-hydrate dehydratase n=1 Tax=Pseudoflavitalea sp. G-6-1-2 TaxID=2728841 RepID=UPI00146A5E1C|nr:NAD(P)H-hydrate dehydratase [Pseudoflavitalea sp. G-6-1-2]NML21500.1 NAD(P)H-hydrate dehydratase [Pseudoflavitalea sp. G-6-1-2]
MQILTAAQIREWDQFTIRELPILSIDLMERASTACFDWLLDNGYKQSAFTIFCGKGNNGGDGLAIARLLAQSGHAVTVNILEFGAKGTTDFQTNLARLHQTNAIIRFISSEETIHAIDDDHIVIDALLGTGLNRPLDGLTAAVVQHINQSGNLVIAIDIPSGLYTDKSSKGAIAIEAMQTLSFQCYKPAFLAAENQRHIGELHILDIGLHPEYLNTITPTYQWIDDTIVRAILPVRNKFAHKGDFGHAALIAGSLGMMGAAVLSAQSCLRSGVGKLTCFVPKAGYEIMQISAPEAMCIVAGTDHIGTVENIAAFNAIGVGPGMGRYTEGAPLLQQLFQQSKGALVLDADALNILGENKSLLEKIPSRAVLTPHVKELERMFGPAANDFERWELAHHHAKKLGITIVLKGAFTMVATPGGISWFNSTGNPGMATGGSGDVLTGIITGLCAQGLIPEQAAIAGVYLHGLAGDLAAVQVSEPGLIASDITRHLGNAYLLLQQTPEDF